MGWQGVWSAERSVGVVAKWSVRLGIIGFVGALSAQITMGTPLDATAVLATGFEAVNMAERTSIPWPNSLAWDGGWMGVVRSDRALSLLPSGVISAAKQTWMIAFASGILALILTAWWLVRSPAMAEEDPDHRRGSVASEQAELVKRLLQEQGSKTEMFSFFSRSGTETKRKTRLDFCGLPLPTKIETRHFLIAGTTGSGKTLALRSLLDALRNRGDRALIVDAGGDLMRMYYQDKDMCQDRILSPGDSRSLSWSPWAEIRQEREASDLAKSIIPDGRGEGKEWANYAQTLLAAILRRLMESGRGVDNAGLLYWATTAPVRAPADSVAAVTGDLAGLIAGTPAARLLDKGSEKMAASVLSIIGLALESYAMLDPNANSASFSIRQWIEDEDNNGWLWIPYRDSSATATMPLRRAWVDVAVRAALDLEPDDNRRVWLILDELPASGHLPRLIDALARGRKYGLTVVAGIQSIAQLRDIYGQDQAQSILSNFGTWLILRQGDNETADYLSRHVGEREAIRADRSEGDDGKQSQNFRSHIDRLLLPSELQRLPDRQGYISLPGDYPITRIEIPIPPRRDAVTPSYIPAQSSIHRPVVMNDNKATESDAKSDATDEGIELDF